MLHISSYGLQKFSIFFHKYDIASSSIMRLESQDKCMNRHHIWEWQASIKAQINVHKG